MSILWVIEKVGLEKPMARALQGDFAVRVFATVESYQKLTRFHRGPVAEALVVNSEGMDQESLGRVLMPTQASPSQIVIVHPPGGRAAEDQDAGGSHHWIRESDDFQLSGALRALLNASRKAGRDVVKFRDVLFDFSKLALTYHSDLEPITLPLKEAQLLKLFLERAGSCLSRAEISSTVWQGVKVTPRTIDSHVSRLRKRLAGASIEIQSIYGDGYILK